MLLYGSVEIDDIVYDSRKAREGVLFVCLRGALHDGHDFAADAYKRGCRAFLCEYKIALPDDAKQFFAEDTRIALAELSAELFGYPARSLKIIGITGTKGKTSVATFIYNALNQSGHKAGMIGTTGLFIDGIRTPTANSTPESYELHKAFAKMLGAGIEYAVMEVSSQAYKVNRVHGIHFDIGVFTNLSHDDHIGAGEHPDFDDYRDCKARLFDNSDIAVVNADDENSPYMTRHSDKVTTFGIKSQCDFKASDIELWRDSGSLGVSYVCRYAGDRFPVTVHTPGEFSVYNSLSVISVCTLLGIRRENVLNALRTTYVKGRFEIVSALDYATFIIDYAHNELSLHSALETLRHYAPKRLICLFGSVGGRTALRRETLGHTASQYADFCIISSDNPDFEPPENITADIERGLLSVDGHCPYIIIPDREKAIEYAVSIAEAGDIVLFAGKGHEDYQLINGIKQPFSERELILKYSRQLSQKV